MKPQEFTVDTRPTKHVVVDSLTRDFSTEATILDLIDNAVDAARNAIFKRDGDEADDGLPTSYAGFAISVDCDGKRLLVKDNCGGMTREELASTVLRFGQRSNHALGIGTFGVGLNRALFKLGNTTLLTTDTGERQCCLELDVSRYIADEDWQLPAIETTSTGIAGTSIEITGLYSQIAKDLSDAAWIDELRSEVATKYSIFVRKGLALSVNGVAATARLPEIREGGPVDAQHKVFNATDKVMIDIRVGQHKDHRFTHEPDYGRSTQTGLSGEFGWTVICNDRVLLVGNKTDKTGWDTFHTEFNGFLGIVAFEAQDPGALPWNTAKTDVDRNNAAYHSALSAMKGFVAQWRKAAEKRKKANTAGAAANAAGKPAAAGSGKTPASPVGNGRTAALSAGRGAGRSTPASISKPDHRQYTTVLPGDVDEAHCRDKLLAVVHEAKMTDLREQTYAGLALIRMTTETAAVLYLRRKGLADAMKTFSIEAREKKRALTDDEKRKVQPSLDELLAFLQSDRVDFGATRKALNKSMGALKGRQGILNGVLHSPDQIVSPDTALAIRDEAIPLLRCLIET